MQPTWSDTYLCPVSLIFTNQFYLELHSLSLESALAGSTSSCTCTLWFNSFPLGAVLCMTRAPYRKGMWLYAGWRGPGAGPSLSCTCMPWHFPFTTTALTGRRNEKKLQVMTLNLDRAEDFSAPLPNVTAQGAWAIKHNAPSLWFGRKETESLSQIGQGDRWNKGRRVWSFCFTLYCQSTSLLEGAWKAWQYI